jgi:hypothetical protein
MKSNRRNQKNTKIFPTSAKDRWLPNDNTRVATFADRKRVANKRACRGKVVVD